LKREEYREVQEKIGRRLFGRGVNLGRDWGSVTKGERYQAQIFFFPSSQFSCMYPWKILNHYYRILEMFNFSQSRRKAGGEEREGDRRWSEIVR
jgi:hypothetical protein